MKKYISPCLETILCKNGEIEFLDYHQRRFDKTRKLLFGASSSIQLNKYLNPPKNRILKIRVIYAKEVLRVEYLKFTVQDFKTFCLVESDLAYDFKYENRDKINFLKNSLSEFDDIVLCYNGFLKDTSIANIAVKLKDVWYTPKRPLLEGTTRQRLLDSGFLKIADLDMDDLRKSSNFAIMNALIGFKEIEKGVFNVASSIK